MSPLQHQYPCAARLTRAPGAGATNHAATRRGGQNLRDGNLVRDVRNAYAGRPVDLERSPVAGAVTR